MSRIDWKLIANSEDPVPLVFSPERTPTLEEIDGAVRAFEHLLSSIKSFRNSIRPIDRVPNEILGEIFCYCALPAKAREFGSYDYSWWKIIFVCKRWNRVAFQTSQLWVYIELPGPNSFRNGGVFDFISHSQDRPLHVHAYASERSWVVDAVFQDYAHRFRTLRLQGNYKHVIPLLQKQEKFPLCIQLTVEPYGMPDDETDASRIILPDSYLVGTNIKQLKLSGDLGVNWKVLQNLTHLEIQNNRPHESDSVGELLDVFRCSPELQELKLTHILPHEMTGDPILIHPPVNLPCLTYLRCNSVPEVLHSLLLHLNLPTSTKLNLVCVGLDDTYHDTYHFKQFLIVLRLCLLRPGTPAFRSMLIEIDTSLEVSVDPAEAHSMFSLQTAPYFSLRAGLQDNNKKFMRRVLLKILHMLPFDCPISLDVKTTTNPENVTYKTWLTILSHLPMIHEVHIGVNECMIDLLDAYYQILASGPNSLSGSRRRSARRTPYLAPIQLSKLCLYAARERILKWDQPVDEEVQKWRYNEIHNFLVAYRLLDRKYKPKGGLFPSIGVTEICNGYVTIYEEARRISPLVNILTLDGKPYQSTSRGELAKLDRHWQRRLRRLFERRKDSNSRQTDSDSDTSTESLLFAEAEDGQLEGTS